MYYGHYDIFKAYTNTLLPFKINGELQHGWSAKSGITSADLESKIEKLKYARYYVFNKRNREFAFEKGYKNVVAIGAPFIYIKNFKKYFSKQETKSLILFPTHTHEYMKKTDLFRCYSEYLDEISKISNNFGKITVSLFWREFSNKNILKLFNKSGISVITMGPRDKNPNFLINFIKEVSKHEYISSDNFCSALFYGLFMKKKAFIFGDAIKNSKIFNFSNYDLILEYFSNQYPELIWNNFDHANHSKIAEKELGLRFKLDPKKVKKLFDWKFY